MPDPGEPGRELVVFFGREGDDDRDPYAVPYGALRVYTEPDDDPDETARFALDHLLRERARVDSAIRRCAQGRWRVAVPPDSDRVRDLSDWTVPADVRSAAAEALGLAADDD
jgi:hypothetical protein